MTVESLGTHIISSSTFLLIDVWNLHLMQYSYLSGCMTVRAWVARTQGQLQPTVAMLLSSFSC